MLTSFKPHPTGVGHRPLPVQSSREVSPDSRTHFVYCCWGILLAQGDIQSVRYAGSCTRTQSMFLLCCSIGNIEHTAGASPDYQYPPVCPTSVPNVQIPDLHSLTHSICLCLLPNKQRYIIRIIFMVPFYCVCSLGSLHFRSASIYFDTPRDW